MNKPYAWVSLPENEIQILPFPDDGRCLVAGDGFYLYTRPSKQLSDEDVEEWLDVYGMDMGDVYEISKDRFVQAVRAIIKEMNDE